VYIVDGPTNPIPNDPSKPRVKGIVKFSLQQDRFDTKDDMMIENDFLGEELIIDRVKLPKTVKGFVDMKRQTEERWKTKLNEDPFYED